LLATAVGVSSGGGVFRSTNALDATPSFTQTLSIGTGLRASLAINKVGSTVTVYAATSETPTNTTGCRTANAGAERKPTDGGVTWSGQLTGGGGFCGSQCDYDQPIAVNPNNADEVYLGGDTRNDPNSCSDGMKKSTNGGASFFRDDGGLHADSHALI